MRDKNLDHYMSLKYPVELIEAKAGGFFVTHPDLNGCMAEGATVAEALANLAVSRELWVEARLAKGYPVPEPKNYEPSGNLSLRMAPSLHAHLAMLADRQGISLNLLINTVLAQYAGGMDVLSRVADSTGRRPRADAAAGLRRADNGRRRHGALS
jgi:antitoxin HicB